MKKNKIFEMRNNYIYDLIIKIYECSKCRIIEEIDDKYILVDLGEIEYTDIDENFIIRYNNVIIEKSKIKNYNPEEL